jgi:hypothetical protein
VNLTTWLRQSPHPHTVRADGQIVQIGNGGRKWSNLAATIESLGATRVECLDTKGEVIRATSLDDDAPAPGVSSKASTDLSAVQCFARLIAEAYEKGTKSYAPLLDSAMQFVENQSQRLAKAEAEIERLRIVCAKLRAELAQASVAAPEDDSMIGGVIQGLLAAQTGAAAPNGGKSK